MLRVRLAPSTRLRVVARAAVLVATAAGLLACTPTDTGGEPDPLEDGTTASGGGGAGGGLELYPPGPYGVSKGQTIQNFAFEGFAAPATARGELVAMPIADFYNPTGAAVFPAGSPYGAGASLPRALGIVVGAVWCAPCQQEARTVLPGKHASLAAIGGQILFILLDASEPGVPAAPDDLRNWLDTFDVAYPAALDPERTLGALVRPDTFPANILVDTRSMTIVDVVSGVPPESYWETFEDLARGD